MELREKYRGGRGGRGRKNCFKRSALDNGLLWDIYTKLDKIHGGSVGMCGNRCTYIR